MRFNNRPINRLNLILAIFIGLAFYSCEWIFSTDEDAKVDYHHKITVTRLFCDSVGNDIFHFYYDSQNKLIKSVHTLPPDGHNIYELEAVYKGNTIGIGEYTYTLDSQNRVVHIVHHSDEYTYEFNGELLVKETSQTAGGHYTTYYFYENGKLVSDSLVSGNFASVTQHTFTNILRPDFMVDDGVGFGLYELKPVSAYLEESYINKTYVDGRPTLSVTTAHFSYSFQNNRVICYGSGLETPKVSDNCMDSQITWTLETNP